MLGWALHPPEIPSCPPRAYDFIAVELAAWALPASPGDRWNSTDGTGEQADFDWHPGMLRTRHHPRTIHSRPQTDPSRPALPPATSRNQGGCTPSSARSSIRAARHGATTAAAGPPRELHVHPLRPPGGRRYDEMGGLYAIKNCPAPGGEDHRYRAPPSGASGAAPATSRGVPRTLGGDLLHGTDTENKPGRWARSPSQSNRRLKARRGQSTRTARRHRHLRLLRRLGDHPALLPAGVRQTHPGDGLARVRGPSTTRSREHPLQLEGRQEGPVPGSTPTSSNGIFDLRQRWGKAWAARCHAATDQHRSPGAA